MTSRQQFIRVVPVEDSVSGRLRARRRQQFIANYGSNIGENEEARAQASLNALTQRIKEFVLADRTSEVNLVLGRVQSGKTAHMIGTTAWCADHGIGLVTVLSGATTSLMRQTRNRFQSDLGAKEPEAIFVTAALPTLSHKESQAFRDRVCELVRTRKEALDSRQIEPMPVITVLKHPKRVQALAALFEQLTSEVGSGVTALVIDDEADQLSPNSKIQQRKLSNLHAELLRLETSGVRYFLAEYTATPQAVLLNEQDGLLQPRELVTIEPGSSYFGLQDLMDPTFSDNRMIAPGLENSDEFITPKELEDAILQFFVTAQIRRRHPALFFSYMSGSGAPYVPELTSCQMLIHPSGRQKDHEKFARLARECVSRLSNRITSISSYSVSDPAYQSVQAAYSAVCGRLGALATQLSDFISEFDVRDLTTAMSPENCFIKVVNATRNSIGHERRLPVETESWNEFDHWILVGGEILGRGITIPALVCTYFLRNPNQHNFDTAVQQMRFCGYRRSYQPFVTVWAPADLFDLYEVMNEVDETLWVRARRWSNERLDLRSSRPRILYASAASSRLNPARRSVISPLLRDRSLERDVILQTRYLANPLEFRSNCRLVRKLIPPGPTGAEMDRVWREVPDLPHDRLSEMLKSWSTRQQSSEFLHTSELFDDELGRLGLADVPLTLFIRGERVIELADRGCEIKEGFVTFHRSLAIADFDDPEVARRDWESVFRSGQRSLNAKWFDSASNKAYVGETQRNLQRNLGFSSTIAVVEPIALKSSSTAKPVAFGLALALLAPDGYNIRTFGR
jgi:hypothetical protein